MTERFPSKAPPNAPIIDAVVIGRNEGTRLMACLSSLKPQVNRLIYVDSGSNDGSVAAAQDLGAEVVELDMALPFTAARARNAGLSCLSQNGSIATPANSAAPATGFVQLVDGDCAVDPDWIATAHRFLIDHPDIAVVCGRRRERFPDASIYNRLCDQEWNTPVGEAKACGGDALMRLSALQDVHGYREDLIAGEEPEMCLRLRRSGWKIWRLDSEMTLHDAQMLRFSQWWKRSRRAGHAFAEGAALHGGPPDHHWVQETRRALVWGLALPVALLLLSAISPWALIGFCLYPAQLLRLSRRMGFQAACFSLLGKFAEAMGVMEYWWNRWRGKSRGILEYK
ncbi:mycofactocin system glycosyltransferase [Phaeobacter sp. CECT 5382]|uniref:glycosyltransferase n=1 Tax=Phaeobacter sp. CECT 5382 TaxID=1712645 RepID=UPI0006DA3222|nr:glycosyltransferase family A protein [Phaeobacter sp. CECT 5382]CUH87524.1 mycofactocin system glycosyltransferase [Phaeobacter sp. CECT 5382]